VAGGRLQASFVADRRHAPGPWRQKASWSSEERFPSRGNAGTWILVGSRERRGLHLFERLRIDDHGVLEKSFEEGSLYPPRHAASHAGRGEVLRSGYLGSREALSSSQPAVAASNDWIDASPASGALKSGNLRGFNFAACLQRRGASSVGLWVTHCPLPSREGGSREPCIFERGRMRSEGERVTHDRRNGRWGLRAVRIGRSLDALARRLM